MAEKIYTKAQIKAGEGFFTSGEWTCVWKIGPDQYITTAKNETPCNPAARLVYGGRLTSRHNGGTLKTTAPGG